MSEHRLYIATRLDTGGNVQLDADRSHYLLRVLRMKPGQSLIVFNGDGGEFAASLAAARRDRATIRVGERRERKTESVLKVHLVQGISRGERMDWVVQKATELGVKRISPVLTEHGIVRLQGDRAARRHTHWQKVAISATEQCGRTRPPLVDPPQPLKNWFGEGPRETGRELVLSPGADKPLLATSPLSKLCVLVGPEGGLSASEYDDAAAAGFRAVSLGPRILRTETAALAALAIVQSAWGDLAES